MDLPGTDADVAVFEGSKGSYEFGVDAVSGSLTVTSKDTGSVDILEGIETLSFGDGPLTVSRPSSDAAFTLTGATVRMMSLRFNQRLDLSLRDCQAPTRCLVVVVPTR